MLALELGPCIPFPIAYGPRSARWHRQAFSCPILLSAAAINAWVAATAADSPAVNSMPVIQLPLISRIQAANRQKIPQGQATEFDAGLPACPIRCSTDSFVPRVRSAGMEPRFNEGDLLYVDSNMAPDRGR